MVDALSVFRICQKIYAKQISVLYERNKFIMKKSVSMLITVVLALSVLAGCDNSKIDTPADDPPNITDNNDGTKDPESPVSDFKYTENDDGDITITEYIGTAAEVVIPEIIEGKNVTEISNTCFSANTAIISVTLPETITNIGNSAFSKCSSLTTVYLSSSIKAIGNGAFEDCTSLSSITLPEGLTKIGNRAFANCIALKQIKIPKGITEIGWESFCYSGLETVELEDGIVIIGDAAFAGTSIRKMVFPQSVKTIGSQAFGGCAELESVSLNEGLTAIGDRRNMPQGA